VSTPQPPGTPQPPPAATPPPSPQPKPPVAPEDDQPSTWQPLLYLKIALLALAIAYAVAFVVENTKQIRIHFVFASANVHLIWEILLLLVLGIVGGVLISQLYRHRRRGELVKERRKPRDPVPDLPGRDKAEGKTGG
jgi:uncharacterized integral membrane protein